MKRRQHINRRAFLKRAAGFAGAATFPYIVPSSALGRSGNVTASSRITMGCIGTGNQGINDMRAFLGDKRVQIVAVCDVNRQSDGYWDNRVGGREPAKRIVTEHYARNSEPGTYRGCRAYEDFRDLLARDDIDAVLIALPDHWHSIAVIEAAKAGKDIYGEKPLSLTIVEGRAMSDAVKRYGRVFQTGSQQRSDYNFRRACELVRNGRIGKLQTVKCGLPGGTPDISKMGHRSKPEPVPDGFNYDMWLGPAPYAPYCPARCHVNFRWILGYSSGQVTDWGGHHPDIAQWGMGTEDTGPVEVKNAKGEFARDGLYNTAKSFYFECIYKNGVKLIISNRQRGGVTFEGTEGWIWADRGRHDANPKSLLESDIGPDEIHLYSSDNHAGNFIDCVISREEPVAPIDTAHRSITIAHRGNIAMLLERDIKWDPDKERFIDDEQADRMLSRPMRSPWHL
ncbi:MAG: Gfo/Idh/MocA family protein [Planctomycetota bacterium]|jgi:predicted dehydrogenase